jgi:hypothetical protein
MPRPDLNSVPQWFHGYINAVDGNDFLHAMKQQTPAFLKLLSKIPEEKRNYRYAKGKWTVKELLQHMLDAERVFGYRVLCFARKEKKSLPSFEENDYALNSKANRRNWNDMVAEFKLLRLSNEMMFSGFDRDQLRSTGIANNSSFSVMTMGFIMVGHVAHHMNILNTRYLNK